MNYEITRLWRTPPSDEEGIQKLRKELIRRHDLAGLLELAKRKGLRIPEMVVIPAGSAVLGSPLDEKGRWDDEDQVEVTLPSFEIGTAPVTQAEYEAVMGTNPSNHVGPDLPVERVSWFDAIEYLNKLSELVGFPVAYIGDRTQGYQWVGGPGFRLPTEAEWEYACRAGTTGARYGELDDIAWWHGNSDGKTHPVRQKKPNAWRLYDTLGDVWEWTWDEYQKKLTVAQSEPLAAVPEEAEAPFAQAVSTGFYGAAAATSALSTWGAATTATLPTCGRAIATPASRRTATTAVSAASEDPEAPFVQAARTGSFGAAATTTSLPTCGRAFATSTTRRSTSTTAVSAAAEENEAPFVPSARSGSYGAAATSTALPPCGRAFAAASSRRTASTTTVSAVSEEIYNV